MAGSSNYQYVLSLNDKMSGALQKVGAQGSNTYDKLHKGQAKLNGGMSDFSDSLGGMGGNLTALLNPYAAAAAGAAALGAAAYKSVTMANDWEAGLAKVNVTAQLTKTELNGLSNKLLEIGKRNIAPIEQIPEAFNKIISAGLDVKTSMDVLEPSLRAAKAGFSDVGETAKAAVSVMNSSGRDINTVYDVLFATLNKGNAEFSDVAQYLPKLIPMARGAGFALEETAGAWAYLTAQGQTSERATTLAQNAMKALSDPDRIKGFKKMGVTLYDNKGKILPLVDIIDNLAKKTKGLSDLSRANFFGKIGMDQEAASFFASATQDAKKFRETIDFTTKSQGQLNIAYENAKTPMDKWKIMQNMLKGNMIELGQQALPIITMMGEKLMGLVTFFQDLYKSSALFRDSISTIGTILTWTVKISMAPLMIIWNIFKGIGGAINWVVSKIPGMGGGIEGFYNKVRPYLLYIRELFGNVGEIMYKVATFDFKGAYNAFKNFKMPSMDAIRAKITAEGVKEKTATTTSDKAVKEPVQIPGGKIDLGGKTPGDGITGGGRPTSITINLNNLVETLSVQAADLRESAEQIEAKVREALLRVLNSANGVAYGN